MNLNFIKMHGCGNDYIFLDLLALGERGVEGLGGAEGIARLSRRLSKRHFSVGGDGMVLILPTERADARMRIFNADGSEGAMCGNALRCLGKLLYESGYAKKSRISIETESGIRELFLSVKDGAVGLVTADMGRGLMRDGTERHAGLDFYSVSVGNEHRVCFVEDADALDIESLGQLLDSAEYFGGSANIEFCSVLAPDRIRVRVFERGSGVTLACGTGACASALVAVLTGRVRKEVSTKVEMDGGILRVVCVPDGNIFMTGGAERVYEGVAEI